MIGAVKQIFEATRHSDTVVVRAMLAKQPSLVDARDGDAATPLHVAVWDSCVDVVAILLAKGATANAKNRRKETPLHLAAALDKDIAAKMLLRHGANVGARDWLARTPLHRALQSPNVAETLIENGADLEARADGGLTPLHVAGAEVASLLLACGANLQSRADAGRTPLDMARERPHETSRRHFDDGEIWEYVWPLAPEATAAPSYRSVMSHWPASVRGCKRLALAV